MKETIVLPSRKEAGTVISLTALFLLLTAVCIGLRPEHVFMVGLYLLLFFASKTTRKLAVALLPFALLAFHTTGCVFSQTTKPTRLMWKVCIIWKKVCSV